MNPIHVDAQLVKNCLRNCIWFKVFVMKYSLFITRQISRVQRKLSRLIIKLLDSFLILLRAVFWALYLPQQAKFKKIWITYMCGGIKLCWHKAVNIFGERRLRYDALRYQLSPDQSRYLLSLCCNKPLIMIGFTSGSS